MMPIHFWSIGLRGSPSTSTEIFTLLEKVMQGHYVPQLSQLIYQRNKGVQNPVINFKGFLPWMSKAYDPCTKRYTDVYFNCQEVQKAFHANVTGISYPWKACSDVVGNYWVDSPLSMLPIYQELIAAGLRIWVFSGDTDAVVLVNTTLYSINALKLPTLTKWYPWNDNGKVGGWSKAYKGLTFVTVTRAGHEVPLHFPRHAFVLFKSFLENKA